MRAISSAGMLVAVATTSTAARAAAWSYTGAGAVDAAYDDNILFVAHDPLVDHSGRLDYAATLLRVSDQARWSLLPRIVAVAYDHDRIYNHTEQYLTISNVVSGERDSSNLSFNLIRDTTLTSELGSTGLTAINKRRQSSNLSWSPSRQVSERWVLGAQFGATVVHYADAARTNLVDYRYGMAALYSSYVLSERSKLTWQLSGGRLQVPDNGLYDNDNYATTLAYDRLLTENWHLSVSAGPSLIRGAAAAGADRGTVYGFSLTRALERNKVSLSVSRDVTPNGLGLLARHEQAALNLTHTVGEHTALSLDGVLMQTLNLLTTGGLQLSKVEYSDVNAGLNWSWAPTWRLSMGIGRGQQVNDAIGDRARRWHGSLGVRWSGLEHVLH